MGMRFTEAIIQQYGGLSKGLLSLLKDFGHLMQDLEPDYRDGQYIFSVPALKLALMANVSLRTISRNLKRLHKMKILIRRTKEDPINGKCATYGLCLPEGYDLEKLSGKNFSTVFGGVKWEDALAAYNSRPGSLKRKSKMSTQKHPHSPEGEGSSGIQGKE